MTGRIIRIEIHQVAVYRHRRRNHAVEIADGGRRGVLREEGRRGHRQRQRPLPGDREIADIVRRGPRDIVQDIKYLAVDIEIGTGIDLPVGDQQQEQPAAAARHAHFIARLGHQERLQDDRFVRFGAAESVGECPHKVVIAPVVEPQRLFQRHALRRHGIVCTSRNTLPGIGHAVLLHRGEVEAVFRSQRYGTARAVECELEGMRNVHCRSRVVRPRGGLPPLLRTVIPGPLFRSGFAALHRCFRNPGRIGLLRSRPGQAEHLVVRHPVLRRRGGHIRVFHNGDIGFPAFGHGYRSLGAESLPALAHEVGARLAVVVPEFGIGLPAARLVFQQRLPAGLRRQGKHEKQRQQQGQIAFHRRSGYG